MRMSAEALGSFWKVVRELDPGEIAAEANRPFRLLICGRPGAGKSTVHTALAGGEWSSRGAPPQLQVVEGMPADTSYTDLCLYVVDGSSDVLTEELHIAAGLARRGVPLLCVVTKMDLVRSTDLVRRSAALTVGTLGPARLAFVDATDTDEARHELIPPVLAAMPDLQLTLGRWLPPFREHAAEQVIRETARVNAELALLSSLPASLPFLNVGVAGADLLVLTKNQVMLVFKLATLYGRSLDSKAQLLVELAPIVGASFLWRTAARALVDLLPGFAAAAPKMLMAFAGTYATGQAAHYYYRLGRRPPAAVVDRYSREALALARRALPQISRPRRPDLPALPPPLGRRGQPEAT